MESVALRYATSLFEIAQEEKSIEKYLEDLKLIKDVLLSDEATMSFFMHYNVNKEDKKNTLDKAFKDSVSIYVLNFVKLLIDKNRMGSVINVVDAFNSLTNQYLGIKEGIIYTSNPLEESEITRIEAVVSSKMDSKVILKPIIDETLIGGIKVVVGNHVMDGSVRNKMELLRHELLRK